MFKALVLILQLASLALLGAGPVWFWDHHGPVGWHASVLWWHPGFDLPDSLATKYADASADGLRWKAAYQANASALATQQKAVEALKAAGDAKLAAAAPLPSQARAGQAAAQSTRDTVLAVKPDDDRCAFARSVDAAFMARIR